LIRVFVVTIFYVSCIENHDDIGKGSSSEAKPRHLF